MLSERLSYGLYWTKSIYSLRVGSKQTGFGRGNKRTVMPSHDLCHLFVAAGAISGNFDWKPLGTDPQIRWAEAYGVAIEILLFWSFNIAHDRDLGGVDPVATILDMTYRHMEQFVDVHYRPFPCSPGEFWRSFSIDIEPEVIRKLYCHYHEFRETEIKRMDDLDNAELAIEFYPDVDIEPRTPTQRKAKDLAYGAALRLKESIAPRKQLTQP